MTGGQFTRARKLDAAINRMFAQNPDKAAKIAEMLYDKAMSGDMTAAKLLLERDSGKVADVIHAHVGESYLPTLGNSDLADKIIDMGILEVLPDKD